MNKVTYTDDVTVIEAQNLNAIQDTIIRIDPADDTGKSIPQNADLDTYTTPGLYFCPNSTTAATLINSPGLNAGFSLVVLAKSTLYQTQLINSGGYLYFRQRSSNGWSSWYSTALLEINNTFKGVVRVQQANSDTSNTQSLISAGNNIPEGTVGASYGVLQLYGSNDKYVFLRTPSTALGANRTIYLPDAGGTVALVGANSANYTPTISAGTGFTYDAVSAVYKVTSDFLFINGRFRVTNHGSTTSVVNISYPSGITTITGVGSFGNVHINNEINSSGLSIRPSNDGTYCFIQSGAGNVTVSSLIPNNAYVIFDAMIPLR